MGVMHISETPRRHPGDVPERDVRREHPSPWVYRVRMSVPELIRIVSRDSPMALAQVERVRAELAVLHPGVRTEVVPVKTTGDKWMGALSQVGGKGALAKEVAAVLLAGAPDLAVHGVKDV